MNDPKFNYEPVLPKPDKIYEREFYFMDQTLQQREQKLERRKQRKIALEKQTEEKQDQKNDEVVKTEEVNATAGIQGAN